MKPPHSSSNTSLYKARKTVPFQSEQAFARTTGVPLISGNSVRLLRDAQENYPTWLAAMEAAERYIHFESYILHEDAQGQQFADLLAAKARAGVRVRVIYDWMGGLGATSNRFWQQLRQAGVEVRCFNPLRFDSPFGWLNRDHRKMLGVDGRIAFVSGLCVGQQWAGQPERGIDPWRDTGIELTGPAVTDVEQAFAQTWESLGDALPPNEIPQGIAATGDVRLRVIATEPYALELYRLDQLIATMAKERLWLTDAYFVGTTSYVQALRAAALDGVDVRLLVPHANDVWLLRSVSRAGYRPLLEAGVRVYEWNGSMLHAKTAVADGYWARVGSSNLNIASWIGNLELDVVVEDEAFGAEMEQMYLDDLTNATEIILSPHNRVRVIGSRRKRHLRDVGTDSASRAAAGALRISRAVGAAITNQRLLGPAEARLMLWGSLLLLAISALAFFKPRALAWPLSILCLWTALSLLWRAYQLHRKGQAELKQSEATRAKPTAANRKKPDTASSLKP
ncbi:MAG: cardiolipin synthase B [Acidobacteria bacterium]|nr:cardiolipin synthase B [Acidobacteriota bacterium]